MKRWMESIDAYDTMTPAIPKPVKTESRISFGLEWYTSEEDAQKAMAQSGGTRAPEFDRAYTIEGRNQKWFAIKVR